MGKITSKFEFGNGTKNIGDEKEMTIFSHAFKKSTTSKSSEFGLFRMTVCSVHASIADRFPHVKYNVPKSKKAMVFLINDTRLLCSLRSNTESKKKH